MNGRSDQATARPVSPETDEVPDVDAAPTADAAPVPPDPPGPDAGWLLRIFGSRAFFRLWIVQVFSAFGDWLGFLAIIEIARSIGGRDTGDAAAISLVLIPRILPGLFLASAGGVIVDRLNRKRLMVACDVSRAGLLLLIPLSDTLFALVVISFFLEIATSLWSPAKEAIVPNITPTTHLQNANSLSLVAAYGTFPLAAVAFAGLAKLAERLDDISWLDWLDGPRLAIGVDSLTFLIAAALVASLPIVARSKEQRRADTEGRTIDLGGGMREVREGWQYIFANPVVRAVMVALGTGMIGGGMLIPLGGLFSDEVLGAGEAGFGIMLFGLGLGVALGVGLLSVLQNRLPKETTFLTAVFTAGLSLVACASTGRFLVVLALVVLLGISAGGVYVLGFTLLHANTEDEVRGRVFAAVYVVVRFCVLIAIGIGPLLATAFQWASDQLFDGQVELWGMTLLLPGVRIALWFAGSIIVAAGVLSVTAFRGGVRSR